MKEDEESRRRSRRKMRWEKRKRKTMKKRWIRGKKLRMKRKSRHRKCKNYLMKTFTQRAFLLTFVYLLSLRLVL